MTVVDSPLPSEPDPPGASPPAARSGVPLELAELCRWEVHEIEIAVSILLADRADSDAEAAGELQTGIAFIDRLLGCVCGGWLFPHSSAPRGRIADLIDQEELSVASQIDLFSIAIWRWDGQLEELHQLRRRLEGRLAKLEASIGKDGGI